MGSTRGFICTWTCVAVVACPELQAQARGPPLEEWKSPVTAADAVGDLAELTRWLPRLAGRFRYDGTLAMNPDDIRIVKGFSDCKLVGEGPGVQCMININWPEIGPNGNRGGPPHNLAPSMILHGLDPLAAKILFLQVDSKGLAEGAEGTLKSAGVLKTVMPCVNAGTNCRRYAWINLNRDSGQIEIRNETWGDYIWQSRPSWEFVLTLRPVDDIPAAAAKSISESRAR
jgi:hypothetical protein